MKSQVYVIAEIGVNHNGRLDLALESIDKAKECGANAVKFQTFKTSKLVSKKAKMAKYQKDNMQTNTSQFEMLEKLELTKSDFVEIRNYCIKNNIEFLSTPFDEESAAFLKEIGVQGFKIGSGDLTNIPFLRKIDMYGLPVLLSTGMSDLEEVKEAVNCFTESPVTILHCTSNYPAASEDINLFAINTLREKFDLPVGYSDHSLGYDVGICSVALGAKVIEKHFTLDKSLPGPDHKASLNPEEFERFVDHIRNAEVFLGNGVKRAMPSEISTKEVARKSIVVTKDLEPGDVLTEDCLTIKRPGNGLPPKYLYQCIGKKVNKSIGIDSVLLKEDVE
ncbi:N-acetylneuraminate synthase [Enterococcus mundtii]|uniref:N-acetylneuraminate synthase n=1 Tax=Enterococcus TaxID=1350 RepID=UPI000D388FAB|nr:N-acetylneuraminate synthase [Enterococcus mundtii]PTO37084.1 N-acetylneuraminate synthase [Enterococcus mundtii]PTO40733.1 N-acetylneuraminate synthase [Enterococcus mundtii]